MTAGPSRPRPPRKPMKTCQHCGTANEPHRTTCRNCSKSISRSGRTICRTPADAFQAGWDDGADDPPLTESQRMRLAALLAPYVRPHQEAA